MWTRQFRKMKEVCQEQLSSTDDDGQHCKEQVGRRGWWRAPR